MKFIRIVLLIFSLSLTSCYKENIEPLPKPVVDIFSVSEVSVSDSDQLSFNMEKEGSFILKIQDYNTGQILSKEKINLITGNNSVKIYTKSLPVGVLYLILDDLNKNEVKRTKIIIK